jgi:Cyclopropane fatty acid synthase and related methyltransferases
LVEFLAPFDRTPKEVARKMLSEAHVRPGYWVFDIGCGDGSILVEAAKMGAFAVGVELERELAKLAKKKALEEGVSQMVEVVVGDFNAVRLTHADVVTLYLTTEGIKRYFQSLRRNSKKGRLLFRTTLSYRVWQQKGLCGITIQTSTKGGFLFTHSRFRNALLNARFRLIRTWRTTGFVTMKKSKKGRPQTYTSKEFWTC